MLSRQSIGIFSDSHAWLQSDSILLAAAVPPVFNNSACKPSSTTDFPFLKENITLYTSMDTAFVLISRCSVFSAEVMLYFRFNAISTASKCCHQASWWESFEQLIFRINLVQFYTLFSCRRCLLLFVRLPRPIFICLLYTAFWLFGP